MNVTIPREYESFTTGNSLQSSVCIRPFAIAFKTFAQIPLMGWSNFLQLLGLVCFSQHLLSSHLSEVQQESLTSFQGPLTILWLIIFSVQIHSLNGLQSYFIKTTILFDHATHLEIFELSLIICSIQNS